MTPPNPERDAYAVEHHPDPIDNASAQEDALRRANLARQSAAAARDIRPVAEGEVERLCAGVDSEEDCGEFVEPQRFAAGRIRCLHCQTKLEVLRKQGLRR